MHLATDVGENLSLMATVLGALPRGAGKQKCGERDESMRIYGAWCVFYESGTHTVWAVAEPWRQKFHQHVRRPKR